ncbi:hypothetical protein FGB62_149g08 [Gracilaria domingensis]|nr:hypothetical protein FGB62_149g08 [Gracilaria domingensis]
MHRGVGSRTGGGGGGGGGWGRRRGRPELVKQNEDEKGMKTRRGRIGAVRVASGHGEGGVRIPGGGGGGRDGRGKAQQVAKWLSCGGRTAATPVQRRPTGATRPISAQLLSFRHATPRRPV